MRRLTRIIFAVVTLAAMVGCSPKLKPIGEQPLRTAYPVPMATATPAPGNTPTVAPAPTLTQFPTASEPAPEKTFAGVGDVAMMSGTHDVSAKVIVAGLQTLIIQSFYFDGKGPKADFRLVKGKEYDSPTAVLGVLEQRVYDNAFLIFRIPNSAGPGTVDAVIVYCPETREVYATAQFR